MAERITEPLDDGNRLHDGPHDGQHCWVEGREGATVAVDTAGNIHQLGNGTSWAPKRPPYAIYRAFRYGVADDPARPGVWRFWTEWHYTGSLLEP